MAFKWTTTNKVIALGLTLLALFAINNQYNLIPIQTNEQHNCPSGYTWDTSLSVCKENPGSQCPSGYRWNGVQCIIENPVLKSALYKFGAQNFYTGGALTSTTYVDMAFQNNMDTRHESLAITGNTPGSQYLMEGDKMYAHVYSTGYYDRWYRFTVGVGNDVELMSPVWREASQTFDITYENIGKIGLSSEATPYWTFPVARLIAVSTNSNVKYDAQWSGATTVSATGASSTTLPAAGSQSSKYTATGATFIMKFQVSTAAVSTSIGEPMLIVSSNTPRTFKAVFMIMWVSFNNTSLIESSGPLSVGFHPISVQQAGYKVYYKVIDAVVSNQVHTGSRYEEIPVDASAVSATVISVMFWCTDQQQPSTAAQGAYDAKPTAYGIVSAYGPAAIIDANGYTVASAAPSAECCYTIITTA